MTRPEDHLIVARDCLNRRDIPALFATLQELDQELHRLGNEISSQPEGPSGPPISVDPDASRSYDLTQSSWRKRVEALKSEVDDILAACQAHQQTALGELVALRSQRRFDEPPLEESGHWFKLQA